MTEYLVVYGNSLSGLTNQVNIQLKLGWMTTGGVAVSVVPQYRFKASIRQ